MKKWQKIILTIISSVFTGFVNGLLGGGGGMLVVPALNKIAGLKTKYAHANALLVMLPLCVVSVVAYYYLGSFDFNNGYYVSGGVILGGIIGAILLKKINSIWLNIIFYLIMIMAGIKMVI